MVRKYKYSRADHLYINSEKGFVNAAISRIYRPSALKKRKGRKLVWAPAISREEMWAELFLHVQEMKDQYPDTNGRICEYCKKPWTYNRRPGTRGLGVQPRGPNNPKNFSIDRLDSTKTYERGNLVFCCSGCNNRKNQVRLEDIINIIRVWTKRQLDETKKID